jgi:hypothetical protein
MMKQLRFLLAVILAPCLLVLICSGQETSALTNEEMNAGETQDWRFNNQGFFTLTNTATSTDKISDALLSKEVTLTRLDGTKYVGGIKNGLQDGRGTLTTPAGTNQHGEWRNGLEYRISGTWVSPEGVKETGTWNRDGTKSGGTITWPDGRQYQGDWKLVTGAPEQPDGMGTMTWPDGRKYVGQFRDGNMDGAGTMTYPNGKIEDGLWKQGKFVGTAQ